ncbi:MAG: nucleotidyltransferase family protein [Prevotella sp.]|jgi:hypothetical protein
MNKIEIFLSLIKSELWQKPLPSGLEVDDKLFQQLMMISKMQTVEGLAVNSLIANHIKLNKYNAAETFALRGHFASENDKVNKELQALCDLLSSHQIKFFVVKGQTLSVLYPHPECRMCGDIDFYVYPDSFDKALQIIEKEWGVKIEKENEDSEQHVNFTHNEILFEMHFCLMRFASRRNQRVFDRMIAENRLVNRLIGNVHVPVLEDELNLVYTFLHLYHHLIELGVGLRQFCDVAILMNHMKMNQAQKDKIAKLLRLLGFTRSFHVVEVLLHQQLGLDVKKMIFPVSTSDFKYETFIMNTIFKRGNFGKFGRKNAIRSGWKYNFEALATKIKNYGMLFSLSPRENIAYFLNVLPKRAISVMKA